MKNFNNAIKIMEKSSATAFEASIELKFLKHKVENRKKIGFLPQQPKTEF